MTNDDKLMQLRRALRAGVATNRAFDRLYAAPVRQRSARFWTPVEVAHRAGRLLAGQNVRTVLDVGAGVGKFCIAAACACPDIEFTGVEHRPHFVEAARAASARIGTNNARFVVGDATAPGLLDFDALYLYNPFAENLYVDSHPLDNTVELSPRRLIADVQRIVHALVAASVGMCLLTYHGFGGPIPATYELAHEEEAGTDWLRLWVKRTLVGEQGAYYRETDDGVTLVRSASSAFVIEEISCAAVRL